MEPDSTTRPARWIVGSDGSNCAEEALRWTLAQAVGRTASVDVVRAWHLPPMAGAEFGVGPLADMEPPEAHAGLDALAVDAVASGVEVNASVRYGGAAHVLLDVSEGADLLVIGSRGHGGFRRLVLGSVSHQCATHARIPVVVVRSAGDDAEPEPVTTRLVVGVDGSPASRAALRWAHDFAQDLPIVTIGAWTPPVFGADELRTELERLYQHAQAAFGGAVDAVEAELGVPGRFDRQFVNGSPAVALNDACDTTTLLVVGECGHRGLLRGLLGSVATDVLHHAPCPVAVIPIGGDEPDPT